MFLVQSILADLVSTCRCPASRTCKTASLSETTGSSSHRAARPQVDATQNTLSTEKDVSRKLPSSFTRRTAKAHQTRSERVGGKWERKRTTERHCSCVVCLSIHEWALEQQSEGGALRIHPESERKGQQAQITEQAGKKKALAKLGKSSTPSSQCADGTRALSASVFVFLPVRARDRHQMQSRAGLVVSSPSPTA